jgi:MFS family permease
LPEIPCEPVIFASNFVGMELKKRQRFSLNIFFFLSGVCFSTWASRIPTIKANFGYNEAELGTLLLFMPISSLVGLPVSGWLVSRYDSRVPLTFSFVLLVIALTCIGFADSTFLLIASICTFSFAMRLINISMNTQAITLQKKFDRNINGAFHGLWSTGGILGVGISTVMVAQKINMNIHLFAISLLTFIVILVSYKSLLRDDRAASGNKLKFGKPDPYIVCLGLLLFFSLICEGGMFDWSGIFLKEVVNVEVFTWGYLTFMICMALSRFASDRIIEKIGMPRTYLLSAALIIIGISLAVIFPYFWTSVIGFCFVGWGTAPVIPMTYMMAGDNKKYSAGIVISIIATYAIVGQLIGPALIGYIAHASSLRLAFITFALSGLMLIPVSRFFFRLKAGMK